MNELTWRNISCIQHWYVYVCLTFFHVLMGQNLRDFGACRIKIYTWASRPIEHDYKPRRIWQSYWNVSFWPMKTAPSTCLHHGSKVFVGLHLFSVFHVRPRRNKLSQWEETLHMWRLLPLAETVLISTWHTGHLTTALSPQLDFHYW